MMGMMTIVGMTMMMMNSLSSGRDGVGAADTDKNSASCSDDGNLGWFSGLHWGFWASEWVPGVMGA
jgi:hypothetical protein